MKSKSKKQEELQEAQKLIDKSSALLFADFSKVSAEDLRQLRRTVRGLGGSFLVLKKRLLNVLFKERGITYDARQFKGPVGTIFSSVDLEGVSGSVYKFFSGLGDPKAKQENAKKILGGYDVKNAAAVDQATVLMLGQLPPREVVLAQLLGMFVAPLRSFMYLLDQKSRSTDSGQAKQTVESA